MRSSTFDSLTLEAGRPGALGSSEAEFFNIRGTTRHAQGDTVAALADFSEALQRNPRYPEAFNNRGVVRHALGDLMGALDDYNQALALRPDYAAAFLNRGLTLEALRDLPGAMADFNRALEIDPEYADAYFARGAVQFRRWEHGPAAADFTEALRLYPPDPPRHARRCHVLVARGESVYHLGDIPGLIQDYRDALALNAELTAEFIVSRLEQDVRENFAAVLANCARHLLAYPGAYVTIARRGLARLLAGRTAKATADLELALTNCDPELRPLLDLLIATARNRQPSQ